MRRFASILYPFRDPSGGPEGELCRQRFPLLDAPSKREGGRDGSWRGDDEEKQHGSRDAPESRPSEQETRLFIPGPWSWGNSWALELVQG